MARITEFRIYTGVELINTPTEEEKYLIANVLWERDHIFLLGKEKTGKSILALQMACCLTSAYPFLSKFEIPEPMDVLYVQTEGKKHDTVERLKAMTDKEQGIPWDPTRFFLLYYHSFALDTQEGMNFFRQQVSLLPRKPSVMFLDPLYMSMHGDLIDNSDARHMVKNIRKISEELNCAVVVVHHQHRQQRDNRGQLIAEEGDDTLFGSFVWKAFPDHILTLYKRKDNIRLFTCHTQRAARVVENVELELIQPFPLYFQIIGEDQKPYVKEVLEFMVKNVSPIVGITAKDLEDKMKLSTSAVKKSLSILIRQGNIVVLNPGRRPCYYAPVIVTRDTPTDTV